MPTVRDRIVQRALLNFIDGKYGKKLSNEVSYGFVKNRTVSEAALKACQLREIHPWIFKTDITSFFDRIPRAQLSKELFRLVRDVSLHPLLRQVIESEIGEESRDQKKAILKLGVIRGVGLRQGMPLSPFLSNVLLRKFDNWIVDTGYKAVRYADDLVFFCDSKQEASNVAAAVAQRLSELTLEIPEIAENSKSVIYSPEQAADFLGLGLVATGGKYELRLMEDQFKSIRQSIREFGDVAVLVSRRIQLKSVGGALDAKINGYLAAYEECKNIDEIENRLHEVAQKALRNLYSEGLGINIGGLTPPARAFLGLSK